MINEPYQEFINDSGIITERLASPLLISEIKLDVSVSFSPGSFTYYPPMEIIVIT